MKETNGQLHEKYGLLTAISMVAGIVIGSGVFFKAEKVLTETGGDLPLGILAWIFGGAVMMICASTFAVLATRHHHVGGLVDYAEALVGARYAYYVGWFYAYIYVPSMTSVLAWVSARYAGVLLGWQSNGGEVMLLCAAFLLASFALNVLSPILAGKFQVSATVIKLIPLLCMAIFGTVYGIATGTTAENFWNVPADASGGGGLFAALVATAFAYEGWILATGINTEIKNAKKNLPLALLIGTAVVAAAYIFYYVGIAGAVENRIMMESGEEGAKVAFRHIFGAGGGTVLMVFVVISCLGTLNGLMLSATRCVYALAVRGKGPAPKVFAAVDPATDMPYHSAVLGLLLCGVWLLYFYGANLSARSWFGPAVFDSSELPIITIYAMYLPILWQMMRKEKDLSFGKRFLLPILSIASCIFMIVAAIYAHGISCLWYLTVFAAVMLIGVLYQKKSS